MTLVAPLTILMMASAPPAAAPGPAAPQPAECPAWGNKPAGCVEPPMTERIRAYDRWREPDGSSPADAVMIRRPDMLGRYDDPLPSARFPAFLRRGDEATDAQVTLALVIAADGSIASCTPTKAAAWAHAAPGQARTDLAVDPALGTEACEALRRDRRFRPAIDAAGIPIEAPAQAEFLFSRQRYEMLAPPAPAPPNRWIGRQPYGERTSWPPRNSLYERIAFTVPKFKDFLTDRKQLPRSAVVGAVLDFAPDGTALDCKIGLPSGDARLDAATCAGLMTVRNVPNRWQVRALPVEVRWSGDKAKIQLPAAEVLPALIAPIAIAAAEGGPATPLRWLAIVRLALDSEGRPVRCEVIRSSDNDMLDAASCRLARTGRYTAGKDIFGRPTLGGIDLRVDWVKREIASPPGLYGY